MSPEIVGLIGILLLICLLFVSPAAFAVEGMVLFTRGSEFGGIGQLKLKVLGGSPQDIEDNVGAAVFSPDGTRIVYAHFNGTDWEIIRRQRDGSTRRRSSGSASRERRCSRYDSHPILGCRGDWSCGTVRTQTCARGVVLEPRRHGQGMGQVVAGHGQEQLAFLQRQSLRRLPGAFVQTWVERGEGHPYLSGEVAPGVHISAIKIQISGRRN